MTGPSASGSTLAFAVVQHLRSLVVPELREVGDLRRNAALYVARQAGSRSSSFERGLRVSIDRTRLTEAHYLAALGYLAAAGLLGDPLMVGLGDELTRLSRRSAHTQERTGFADDPVCACGLFLLATAVNDGRIIDLFRNELSASEPLGPTARALIAIATSASARSSSAVDPASAEDVASALLSSRFNPSLGKRAFPGAPADVESHLLALVTQASYVPTADLGAMIVLAALEASLALPNDELPAADGSCEVGIIIALKEEFRVLFERIKARYTHVEEDGRAYYIFDVPTLASGGPYRCVATLVGDMGTNRTGIISEKLLDRWEPAVVAIVGIAAGVHNDVKLGDVIVASQVDNYLEGAKIIEGTGGAALKRSSDSFKTSHTLVERARNFEFASSATYSKWQTDAELRRASLGPGADGALSEGLLRERPEVKEGHLASGPVVVASETFLSWVRDGDRACLGIEMEAAGLMIATHMDPSKTAALIIRGVSDFGDQRKAKLDGIGSGALRRYAMENATSYLWALLEAGALPRLTG